MKSRFTCSPTFELGRYFVLPVGGQSCQVEAEIPAGHQPEHVVCRQGRGHRMIEIKSRAERPRSCPDWSADQPTRNRSERRAQSVRQIKMWEQQP
jgi:hypothetical protein